MTFVVFVVCWVDADTAKTYHRFARTTLDCGKTRIQHHRFPGCCVVPLVCQVYESLEDCLLAKAYGKRVVLFGGQMMTSC